jgi:hypothetical protein
MVERHMNEMELKGFTPSIIEILFNSIYGEPITVTSDNVQHILPADSLLRLNENVCLFSCFSSCCTLHIQRQDALFCGSHLESANCWGIY